MGVSGRFPPVLPLATQLRLPDGLPCSSRNKGKECFPRVSQATFAASHWPKHYHVATHSLTGSWQMGSLFQMPCASQNSATTEDGLGSGAGCSLPQFPSTLHHRMTRLFCFRVLFCFFILSLPLLLRKITGQARWFRGTLPVFHTQEVKECMSEIKPVSSSGFMKDTKRAPGHGLPKPQATQPCLCILVLARWPQNFSDPTILAAF